MAFVKSTRKNFVPLDSFRIFDLTRAHGAPQQTLAVQSDKVQEAFRKSAELKYQLMPYVYAQASALKRAALVRALFVNFRTILAWMIDDICSVPSCSYLRARNWQDRLSQRKVVDYQTGKVYPSGWNYIEAGELAIILLVRDGSAVPHIELAQSTADGQLVREIFTADVKRLV